MLLDSRDKEAMELAKKLFVERTIRMDSVNVSTAHIDRDLKAACLFVNRAHEFFDEQHCKSRK